MKEGQALNQHWYMGCTNYRWRIELKNYCQDAAGSGKWWILLSRCRLDLDADTDIVGLLMRLFSNWVACPLGGGLEYRGLNSLHLWGRVCVWSWSPTLLLSTCLLDLQAHPPGLPVQPRWARPQAYPRLGLYAIVKIWRKGTKSQRGLHLNDAQSEWLFFSGGKSVSTHRQKMTVAKTLTKDLEEQDLVLIYIVTLLCLWTTLFPHISVPFLSNGEFHLCSPILYCSYA